MKNELETYQLIQDYLRGNLSDEEINSFEERLSKDSEFKEMYEEEKSFHEMTRAAIKEDIAAEVNVAFQKSKVNFQRRNWFFGLLAMTGLGLAGYFLIPHEEPVNTVVNPKSVAPIIISEETETSPSPAPKKEMKTISPEEKQVIRQVSEVVQEDQEEQNTDTVAVHSQERTVIDTADSNNTNKSQAEVEVVQQQEEKVIDPCQSVNVEVEIDKTDACLFGEKGQLEIVLPDEVETFKYWLNGDSMEEPFAENLSTGTYQVLVKNLDNCTILNDKVQINSKRCEDLPKAFNADQEVWTYPTNDVLVELTILSKYGKRLITISAENPEWDGHGSNGEQLSTDDYIFIVSKEGKVIDKGNVTLVRQ